MILNDEFTEPEPVKKITYIIHILSAAEMKKPKTKREPRIDHLELNSDEPFDTFKAQILVRISTAIRPKTLNFAHYYILFNIPRVVAKPGIPCMNKAGYALMLQRALTTKVPTVNLYIESQEPANGPDKENKADEDAEEATKKKINKVRVSVTF